MQPQIEKPENKKWGFELTALAKPVKMLGVAITAIMILDYKHKMHTYLRYT